MEAGGKGCVIGLKRGTVEKINVLFRDYLIRHPALAKEYAELKTELAWRFPTDRDAYLNGKMSFIDRVLSMARE